MNCIDFTTKVCGCARNFHLAHGVWQKEVTQWDPRSDRKARVAGLGTCPSEAEAVCRHCLQIFTAEAIKIRNCRINTLIVDRSVSR